MSDDNRSTGTAVSLPIPLQLALPSWGPSALQLLAPGGMSDAEVVTLEQCSGCGLDGHINIQVPKCATPLMIQVWNQRQLDEVVAAVKPALPPAAAEFLEKAAQEYQWPQSEEDVSIERFRKRWGTHRFFLDFFLSLQELVSYASFVSRYDLYMLIVRLRVERKWFRSLSPEEVKQIELEADQRRQAILSDPALEHMPIIRRYVQGDGAYSDTLMYQLLPSNDHSMLSQDQSLDSRKDDLDPEP